MPGWVGSDEDPAVGETGVGPGMISLVGERKFLTGFCPYLTGHHHVATRLWVLSIPNRRVAAISRPSLIEVGMRAVGELMEAGSIRIDDMDGGLPFRNIGIVFQSAEEDEHVVGLRPRGLEVVVTSGERFALGLTVGVDVDFAVHVIRTSIGFIPDCGSVSGDMGEDPDERGSSVGHLRIDTAFLFPELADQGLLFGFETGHDLVDVGLVAVSVVAFGKRIFIDTSEKLGLVGSLGGGPSWHLLLKLLRGR